MKRKKTPAEIETDVLLKSVRRCTLCFYLSGELKEKIGQIAHVDKDPSNFAEDNLAFMCLEHHTLFDSRTSQHKNYTPAEVKAARARLYEAIAQNRHMTSATVLVPNGQAAADYRFFEQRRCLGETPLMKKIWGLAHWQIAVCPTEFMDARFQDLSHCAHFMQHNAPKSLRYHDCPIVRSAAIENDTHGEWIAGEFEQRPEIPPPFLERWVLFRSGQFAMNRAVIEHDEINKKLHYLEVIWLVTQVFQLAARMAREGALATTATVRFQLHNVSGRGLYTADFFGQYWSRAKDIDIIRSVKPADLLAHEGSDLAFAVALEIYRRFGWEDAPCDKIAEQQRKL
jgi:hypothetical protein